MGNVNNLLKKIDIKKKLRAFDSEMVKLQKSKFIKYFYYPAISYLNIEDAKKVFMLVILMIKEQWNFTNFYILTLL